MRKPISMIMAGAAVALLGAGCAKQTRKEYQAPAFGADIADPPLVSRPLTYHADVEPIIQGRCATCHASGKSSAPFTLESYSDVQTHASAVKAAIASRIMPPYSGLNSCNDYDNDWSLTEDQRGIITSWIDQGAPEGDPSQTGATIAPIQLGLTRTDLTLGPTTPYLPVQNTDDYHCFLIDWPEAAPMYVTGFDVKPGNLAVVHHVLVFAVPPDLVADAEALNASGSGNGYTCFGGPGVGSSSLALVGSWVPGVGGGDAPVGTGTAMAPGSKLIMQVHYNTYSAADGTPGKGQPDLSKMLLKVDPVVARPAATIGIANPNWIKNPETMLIKAGESGVIHEFELDPTLETNGKPFLLHRVTLHQHKLGTRSRLSLVHADGTETCLLDIARWDFNWQQFYDLANPIQVQPGDAMKIQCEWDNDVPNSHDVTWGEGTKDEMCLGGAYVSFGGS